MQFVKTPEAGVPNAGLTRVGEVANTLAPVPVSSEITPASSEEEVAAKKKADDQILKDIEDTVKRQKEIDDAAAKYTVTLAEVKYKQEVLLIRATSKTKEEADRKILELDEANLKTTISNLNEELMAVKDGSAEWYNIKSELAKAEQAQEVAKLQNQVSNYIQELVVFNDPDDDRYIDDEYPLSITYLSEDFISDYMIFRNIANGDIANYRYLINDISRLEMFRIYAMNLTYLKETGATG